MLPSRFHSVGFRRVAAEAEFSGRNSKAVEDDRTPKPGGDARPVCAGECQKRESFAYARIRSRSNSDCGVRSAE